MTGESGEAGDTRKVLDIFLGSYKRPEKLAHMLESVMATRYPVRVLVAAGDPGTVETCQKFGTAIEVIYSTHVNRLKGCTAPLNMVFRNLVRNDALFCTDDCEFDADAFEIAMTTLYEKFPDGDGVVGLAQENIVGAYDLAFPLFGKAFLDRFRGLAPAFTQGIKAGLPGDIFWPGYFHLFNDAEIGLTIKCMGNWVFEPRAKLRHYHPECGGGEMDATHNHGLTFKDDDRCAWTDRRARGVLWGLDVA